MLRRRVPALKLLGRLPNVVALCPQSVRKASAKRPRSVCKRSQAFARGVMRAVKGELHRTVTGRVCPQRSEFVKLRRNSTGRAPPWRSTWRSAALGIRQAKGELHRTRAAVAFHVAFCGVPRGVLRRSESVKLRGTPQGCGPVVVVVPYCWSVVAVPWRWSRGGLFVVVVRWWWSVVVVRIGGPWWSSVVVVPWRWSWWSVVWSRGGGPLVVIPWW